MPLEVANWIFSISMDIAMKGIGGVKLAEKIYMRVIAHG
jgi:hypothetical protein